MLLAGVEEMLASGADPNAEYGNGETPLHRAVRYEENVTVIEVLLAAGVDPNAGDAYDHTPLHGAAENTGNLALIEAFRSVHEWADVMLPAPDGTLLLLSGGLR